MFCVVSRHLDRLKDSGRRYLKSRIPKSHQILVKNIIWEIRKLFIRRTKKVACPENFHPKVSIVVPVFNGFDYLQECFESLVNQDYKNLEIILVEDCSTDPRVFTLLTKYERVSNLKIIYHRHNSGISSAINTGIATATGHYIGLVDCDDYLPEDAVSRMVAAIKGNFGKKYYFSNRINLEMIANRCEKVSFAHKAHADYRRELLSGMFADHFKMFDRQIFIEVGLLRSEWDDVQDFEFALRTAFFLPDSFQYANDYLYFHRVYPEQISSKRKESQKLLAAQVERKYRDLQEKVTAGGKTISVVILSFNKIEHTLRCIEAIKNSTEGKYEIILFDNGSSEHIKEKLVSEFKNDPKVKLVLSEKNLGCPGGRMEAIKMATGSYVFTLDNDIVVSNGWDLKLVERIEQSSTIGAAVCKVVFPNSLIQFTGGYSRVADGFIEFGLYDHEVRYDATSTMVERDCDWVPGGATLYRREVFDKASISDEFINNFEDNDFCLQLKKNGWRLVSCPAACVLHNHVYFDSASRRDHRYMSERYKRDGIAKSAMTFYRRNGLIIKDPFALGALGLADKRDHEIVEFFRNGRDCRGIAGVHV